MTYSEILVCGFLPFLGHRAWRRPCERMYCEEEASRDANTDSSIEQDLSPLSGGILRSRAVRAKGNPPSWYVLVTYPSITSE
jgi:hypothetical protein